VRLLIECGTDVSSRDNKGWTLFHSALKSGHLCAAKSLLECGVNVDVRNGNQETALDLASGSGEIGVVRFLIKQGANVHAEDNKGWNPLHVASQNGHLNIVRLLVQSHIDIDVQNGPKRPRWPWCQASGRSKSSASSSIKAPTRMRGTIRTGLHYTLPHDSDMSTWCGCYWIAASTRTSTRTTVVGVHYTSHRERSPWGGPITCPAWRHSQLTQRKATDIT